MKIDNFVHGFIYLLMGIAACVLLIWCHVKLEYTFTHKLLNLREALCKWFIFFGLIIGYFIYKYKGQKKFTSNLSLAFIFFFLFGLSVFLFVVLFPNYFSNAS